ncbi:protein-methionine-sulfoxide reductase heme-binding subunit MsrQ [Roseixanthobacter glucoisosaccharinicivorans]|uniref:sulfite oxidase heme-binding subunit YedZ n=1 Tax=Roseixanthobacter glucoisosaccharinicivorans TaxID=3119923 RepID=UPI00372666D3
MALFHERNGKFSPELTLSLLGGAVPVLWLAGWALAGDLGGRPVAAAIHFTGLWAVRFLLLSLAVTPVRRLFHWPKLVLARRNLGLAALFYAVLHLGLFVVDQGYSVTAAGREIILRFYLTIGAVAVALLLALGGTSFDRVIRRMGAKRWNALHASVYAIAILAIAHFLIQSKLDVTEAVMMGGLLIALFVYRIVFHFTNRVGPLLFAGVTLVSTLLTGLGEVAWYGLLTGVNPWLVAAANFQPQLGVSPAGCVLIAGLSLALAAAVRQVVFPPAKAARAKKPAGPKAPSPQSTLAG